MSSSGNIRGSVSKWHWQDTEDIPEVRWQTSKQEFQISNEKIDLRREIGLRIWIQNGGSQTKVLFQFHHACTDGIGAYRFIGDVLSAYHSLYHGEPGQSNLPEIEPNSLPNRFQRLHLEIRERGWLRRLGIMLREGLNYVGLPITRIHPPASAKPIPSRQFPGIISHSFSEEEHRQIKRKAAAQGFSVNDLLASDLLLTIDDWNRKNPSWSWSWRKRVRLSVPTDMRDQNDYATSASNLTALVFLTRHQRHLKETDQLRSGIREEILKIRNSRKGLDNLITLDVLANLPFPALWLSTRATCCYSAVLSNIGDPTRRMLNRFEKSQRRLVVGNLQLALITGVPPMRPDTNAAISTFTYRRLLTISLRLDPKLFGIEDTRRFLESYVSRIWANTHSP